MKITLYLYSVKPNNNMKFSNETTAINEFIKHLTNVIKDNLENGLFPKETHFSILLMKNGDDNYDLSCQLRRKTTYDLFIIDSYKETMGVIGMTSIFECIVKRDDEENIIICTFVGDLHSELNNEIKIPIPIIKPSRVYGDGIPMYCSM